MGGTLQRPEYTWTTTDPARIQAIVRAVGQNG
jgi:hypothetical protein